MTTAPLQTELMSLDDIYALAEKVLTSAGCDADNAAAIASTVARAERDGSASHGLFRIPGYVGSLRSGKVSGGASATHHLLWNAACQPLPRQPQPMALLL